MSIEDQILNCIIENKSTIEIKKTVNITDSQLLFHLKNLKLQGYHTYPEINNCGDVIYHINKTLNSNLIQLGYDKTINMIAISDLHFGSDYERLDLLNNVYEYAIKNDIRIILNLGDLIHGCESKLETCKQLEKVIKDYPYDDNIKNIILLGNHDFHSLHYDGYDIAPYLFSERSDFFNAGYGIGYLEISNQRIGLFHNLSVDRSPIDPSLNTLFNLYGHSHSYKTSIGNVIKIKVPTLSDIMKKDCEQVPAFLHLNLQLSDDKIAEKLYIKCISVLDKCVNISESNYHISVLKKKK